jgi:predicted HicB family RNase H-like nuclease
MIRAPEQANRRARRSRLEPERQEARLAVNLPIQIHRQLKVRAAEEGMSIRDYVLSLLRREGIGR